MIQKVIIRFGISRKRAIQFEKLFIIVLCWLFVGLLISVYDHFALHSELAVGASSSYSFLKNLTFNLLAALLGSIMGSIWLIFYVNERRRDKPYGITLLLVALSFVVIVIIITITLGLFFVKYETGHWPFSDADATQQFYANISNPFHLKNIVIWANIVLLTQLGLQVNDKFGQGLLYAFIKGKYHSPKKESRVFMFCDLISSTTIAEQLGNEKYYRFIRDFFADITNSIIYNGGKIYQYVGDEVVISWNVENENINHDCLNCYFDMRRELESRRSYYESGYGLLPDFKAAIHYGEVTAGEIGIIKRDLTFSGDVLNTTARIMTFCKSYGRKLLVSDQLFQKLSALSGNFVYEKMGEVQLRGKSEMTGIYAVGER